MPTIAVAFRDHQGDLLDQLDDARALLLDQIPPVAALIATRAAIGRAMADYQHFKHRHVYDPIIASRSAETPIATALKEDCIALTDAFEAYVAVPPDEPAADRQALLDMTATITRAMIREFALVQQLSAYRDLADHPIERNPPPGA